MTMIKGGLSLIIACLLLGGLAVAAIGPRDGRLDQVLAGMEASARQVRTIEAHLTQEKRNGQIGGRPELNEGTIYFKHEKDRKDKIHIKYSNGQQVVVDGREIMLYQPRINQEIKMTVSAEASRNEDFALIATPYSSVAAIKARYNVSFLRDAQVGSSATSAIQLEPKTHSSIVKIIMFIEQSSSLPIRYEIFETNDDLSTFTLRDVRKNGQLPADVFKIDVPHGTKIVHK
jgi:outer membrane lipoprotein-sorting protein